MKTYRKTRNYLCKIGSFGASAGYICIPNRKNAGFTGVSPCFYVDVNVGESSQLNVIATNRGCLL